MTNFWSFSSIFEVNWSKMVDFNQFFVTICIPTKNSDQKCWFKFYSITIKFKILRSQFNRLSLAQILDISPIIIRLIDITKNKKRKWQINEENKLVYESAPRGKTDLWSLWMLVHYTCLVFKGFELLKNQISMKFEANRKGKFITIQT